MNLKMIAAIFLALLFAGYKGHEKGLWKRWFGKQPSELSKTATEATLLEGVNAKRLLLGFTPLVSDDELDEWISEEAAAIVPGEKGIDRFLRNLEMHLPAVCSAKAIYAENTDAEAIVNQLKDWNEVAADQTLTHLSVHVFPKSSWKRFRAVAVAVKKLQRFDTSLLGIGQGDSEVYNICTQCGRAHVMTVTRSSLAVALHCDRCDEDYDIYAMRLDGSYIRVTELLKGYEGLAVFEPGMSKFEEMMAIWSAVLTDFTYTKDMKGTNGHQDTWQTATETALFRNGDCEDTSIFMADWLISRGIDARVAFGLVYPGEGHAWCVARVDGEEYILESTGGIPDLNAPPQTTSTSETYLPIAMFDRKNIYFRTRDGWTPRYWAETEWRAVSYPETAAPSPGNPRLGEFEISSQYFGRDRITQEQLAAASGAAMPNH